MELLRKGGRSGAGGHGSNNLESPSPSISLYQELESGKRTALGRGWSRCCRHLNDDPAQSWPQYKLRLQDTLDDEDQDRGELGGGIEEEQ